MSEKIHKSLEDLTKVLSQDEEHVVIPSEGNALYQACSIIGAKAGIDFTLPASKQSLTLQHITRESGVRYRTIYLTGDWWKGKHGHLLGFYKDSSQPVALLEMTNGYLAVDPETGNKETIDSHVAERLFTSGVMFYRSLGERLVSGADLLRYTFSGFQSSYLSLFWLAMITALIGFFFPIANKVLFDRVIPNFHLPLYFQVIFGLFIAVFSTSVFSYFRSLMVLRLEGALSNRIEMGLWDRLFRLPVGFFRKFTSGDLIQRTMIVENLQKNLNTQILNTLVSSVFSLLSLVMMLYYSWKLSLLGIAMALLSTSFTTVVVLYKLKYDRKLLESNAKINGFLNQVITAISKIRIASAEDSIFNVWSKEFAKNQRMTLKAKNLLLLDSTFNSFLSVFSTFALFFTVIWLLLTTENSELPVTIGSFLAFNAAYGPFVQALESISSVVTSIAQMIPFWERVKPIFNEPLETTKEKVFCGELEGGVQVSNLFFRYHKHGRLILNDIQFHVEPGEFVAISGPSGCGKSSLLRLLVGFEKAETGSIHFDQYHLEDINLSHLREQVAAVLQNFSLFHGTLLQNIVCDGQYNPEQIENALIQSTLIEELKHFPMGLHTLLPSAGGTLSGGQVQKVLLARALIRQPKILILDEATRMLDNQTENAVMKNIEKMQLTRIVVSHRQNAIKHADRILKMSDGALCQLQ